MTSLARDLRHETKACEPLPFCIELGLVDGKGSYQRQAGGVLVRCVAHEERTPSMSVTRGKDGTIRVRCFACDFTADAVGLVQRVRGCDFRAALAEIARITGRWDAVDELEGRGARRERETPPRPAAPPPPSVDLDLCDRVYARLAELCGPLGRQHDVAEYVRSRSIFAWAEACGVFGLPPRAEQPALVADLASDFGAHALVDVGLVKPEDEARLRCAEHRLAIPWRERGGRIIQVQRRILTGSPRSKYVFAAGVPAPADCYGADLFDAATAAWRDAGEHAHVCIVEGALDALAMRTLETRREHRRARVVLAIPSASTIPATVARYAQGRDVFVTLDADERGELAAEKLIDLIDGHAREIWRERSVGAKDAGDVLARRTQ